MDWKIIFSKESLFLLIIGMILLPVLTAIWKLRRVPSTVKQLKLDNRPRVGSHKGKHHADRFIEIWYFRNLVLNDNQTYISESGKSFLLVKAIHKEIEDLGLISKKSDSSVQPIVNLRNSIVVSVMQKHLIRCCGDKKSYYKELKKHRANILKKHK